MTDLPDDDPPGSGSEADARRRILEQVAEGSLTPQQATEALARLEAPEPPPAPEMPPPGSGPRIVIQGTAGAVDVIGDASVRTVEVSGPHELRDDGGVVVIDCEPILAEVSDEHDEQRVRGIVMIGGRGGRARRFGLRRSHERTTVRVRPDLAVDVRVNAGVVKVRGLRGPLRCDVAAGAVSVDDHHGTIGGTVSAGSLKFAGRIDGGDEELRLEAGAAKLVLDPASDVTVTTEVTLGSVGLSGADGGSLRVGAGRGRLAITGSLSSVKIAVGA